MTTLDYASRLEKKIDVLQTEVKTLTDIVTRLSVINENHISISERNTQDIKELTGRIDSLDRKEAGRESLNSAFKWFTTTFSGVLLASCGWLFFSIQGLEKQNATIQSEIQHLKIDMVELEDKVGR